MCTVCKARCVCAFYLSVYMPALVFVFFAINHPQSPASPGVSFIYAAQCLTAQFIINLFQLTFVFSSVSMSNSRDAAIFSCLSTSGSEDCRARRGAPWISNAMLSSANEDD